MERFAQLFSALDATTRTGEKTAALAAYFREAPEPDRLWTVALLSGRRPKRAVTATRLAEWAADRAGLPGWLFDESYAVTGDLAETIALILPPAGAPQARSLSDWIGLILTLSAQAEPERRAAVLAAWDALDGTERFLFNKLITGGFRMGVARGLMVRALAQATGIEEPDLAHRLMGDWTPERTTWAGLILTNDPGADLTRPYPFCLAHPLEAEPATLGDPSDWAADWKWDGIRGQAVLRGGRFSLWSRGEDLVTDRFPELAELADRLPQGTVVDGEILAFRDGRPLPFAALQTRIGRKTVTKKQLAEAPVVLMAYDLLEAEGRDLRGEPFDTRRAGLEALAAAMPGGTPFRLSPLIPFADWPALAAARAGAAGEAAEGVMVKRRGSPYHTGRKRGDWWKWKLDPMSFDAVMVYAQAGHGRRANLYTDFTFALWDGDVLVPVTKAYSGLTDAEFNEITAWVRRHTLERFGPVRRVAPDLVFEIAFEGIQESSRHKSGIALRFPRMARWRRDKPAAEADTIDTARDLLRARGP
ncbi:ATP-dependent DNA ligase [Frigidibacter oleivorans]|uniref:ATP-dependent DNA ligase n=1 Tax=Frigidibacter oleivorans TaxID=2487129 RepID=UPI000F8F3B35|nr:ATP-dependent DNA ligase [Frigidibacter oleivorans]